MATVPKSFKQQCPSCEAMVPVRDPQLVGKKIDCPKCKYRFVVKAPDDDEVEDTPKKKGSDKVTKAPASKSPDKAGIAKNKTSPKKGAAGDNDEDRPAKKKKGGSSNLLMLGIILAGVGLIAIVVCVMFIPWGGSGTPAANNNPNPPSMPGAPNPDEQPGNQNPPPPKVVAKPNVTNLLPNDTQVVISYPMDKTLGSSLKTIGLEGEGSFRPQILESQLGLPLTDVERIISAISHKNKWVFTVVRTKKPIKEDAIKESLALEIQPKVKGKAGKMHDMYLIRGALDSLGTLLLKANHRKDTFAVHFLEDKHTVVFADVAPLTKFLEEDGQPEHLTKPVTTKPSTGGQTGQPGMGQPGQGTPMPGMGSQGPMPGQPGMVQPMPGQPGTVTPMPGAGSSQGPMPGAPTPIQPGGMGPGGMGPGGMGQPGEGQPGQGTTPPKPEPVRGNYLTIEPALKSILDRIEREAENPMTRKREINSCLTIAADSKFYLDTFAAARFENSKLAKQAADQKAILNQIRRDCKYIGTALINLDQATVHQIDAYDTTSPKVARKIEQDARAQYRLVLPILRLAGLKLTLAGERPEGGNTGGMDMGGMGPGTGVPPMPGTGSSQGPPPVKGGGSGPGPIVPPMPGGPGGPGQPGQPGQPGGNTEEEKDGTITLTVEGTLFVMEAEITLKDPFTKPILDRVNTGIFAVKSAADLANTRSWEHDLASATQAYLKAKGAFPQGTLPRTDGRGVAASPDQRLSFYASLVPYLGPDYSGWRFEPNRSWNEGNNLLAAQRVIPHLVGVKQLHPADALVKYPGVEQNVGATYFVGMAGVGLDAADFTANDAATAKKLGVFGYDRVTKKDDIKDGLDQTIVLIMVPADYPTPWLAGGGSTVRGVSEEDNPLEPFVCYKYVAPKGKRAPAVTEGTLAIMADGKVRFLPKNMPAATFRGLCTIAGGEKIDDFDEIAPVIPAPNASREIKTGGDVGIPIQPKQPTTPPKQQDPKQTGPKTKQPNTGGSGAVAPPPPPLPNQPGPKAQQDSGKSGPSAPPPPPIVPPKKGGNG